MELRWYFDFISPFSYLHWQKLKQAPWFEQVQPVPIVFGAVLQHLGTRGPAEIPHKREFTYRHVQWQAQHDGVTLRFPPAHPFNPLAALRLCIAAGSNAQAVDVIWNWIWRDGQPGDSAQSLGLVAAMLGITDIETAINAPETKRTLRANTEAATAAGVFGVPTLAIGNDLYWGNDAHGLMLDAVANPKLLQEGEMARLSTLPITAQRSG